MKHRFLIVCLIVFLVVTTGCVKPNVAGDSPAHAFVFIARDKTVSIVDTGTDRVVESKPVGFKSKWPSNRLQDGEVFWTVDDGTNNVIVVNLTNFEVLSTIEVGNLPLTVELTPDRKFAYVSIQMDDEVAVIDTSSKKVIKKIQVPKASNMTISHPCDTAITGDGRWIFVPNEWVDTMSVISAESQEIIMTIKTGGQPWKVAISPDDKYLLLINRGEDTVSIYSVKTKEEIKKLEVGKEPYAVEFSPDGKFAYIANIGEGSISVIEISELKVVKTIHVGKTPTYIAFTPDGRQAYVSISGDDMVAVIDTIKHEVVNILSTGKRPRGILVL